ncbi:MAG: RluA family pseudouridine synthase [Phycisphaerales bacterium]
MHHAHRTSRALLEIVHRADRFVVINKPAGMLSVPGKGDDRQDCVASRVRTMFPHASGPITVHRLDMDTSGLLVAALDEGAQRELSRQFECREVEKRYVALVTGVVEAESGTIDAPVRPDYLNRPYQVVDPSHNRPAITGWRVLAFETDRTRIELTPLTGRTHQLRVHCAHAAPLGLGHEILGDVLYGSPVGRSGVDRLMLHASRLALTDPDTGDRVELSSSPPF